MAFVRRRTPDLVAPTPTFDETFGELLAADRPFRLKSTLAECSRRIPPRLPGNTTFAPRDGLLSTVSVP
jgi:hypothetical protein